MERAKIGYEKKVEIARGYLSGKTGYKESIRPANNSESSFSQWIAQYKAGGAAGLLPQNKNKHYAPEVKLGAVLEYLAGGGKSGENLREIWFTIRLSAATLGKGV